MRGKKYVLMLTLTFLLGALIPSVPPVKASSTVRFYVVPITPNYHPGLAPGNDVFFDVYIDSPQGWWDTTNGIVGWGMSIKVDPDVLIPWSLIGGSGGYFLFNYTDDTYGGLTTVLMTKKASEGLFYEVSEFIDGWESDPYYGKGAGGDGKLLTLKYRSDNETAYSLVDLGYPASEDIDTAYYYTSAGKVAVDVIFDGHYNAPPDLLALHSTSSLINLTNPVTTSWQELWPTGEGSTFSLTAFSDLNDDSMLSPGDAVTLGSDWYTVEKVTVTFHDTKGGKDRYLELLDGHVGYDAAITTNPVGTLWTEWYFYTGDLLNLTDWEDDDATGNLTVGDRVYLTYIHGAASGADPGDTFYIDLDEVSTDLMVSGPIAEPPEFPLGFALEIGLIAAIAYVWWRSRRKTKITKQPKLITN